MDEAEHIEPVVPEPVAGIPAAAPRKGLRQRFSEWRQNRADARQESANTDKINADARKLEAQTKADNAKAERIAAEERKATAKAAKEVEDGIAKAAREAKRAAARKFAAENPGIIRRGRKGRRQCDKGTAELAWKVVKLPFQAVGGSAKLAKKGMQKSGEVIGEVTPWITTKPVKAVWRAIDETAHHPASKYVAAAQHWLPVRSASRNGVMSVMRGLLLSRRAK